MTKDKDKPREDEGFEDDVSRKMDGSMRRLLKKNDTEIRKQYTRDKRRLARERKNIEEATPKLPPTAISG